MANVKIADLPAAGAVGTSVVPVMNAAGTATNAVTLASIAALGGGAPAAHKASHATGGSDALTAADIGAASSSHTHAASDIASGTLDIARIPTGSSSSTVCLGNDARLSDARSPSAHKASHATGGADALSPADIGAASSSHTHAAGDISGLSTVATSGSYADLTNKPTIPTLGSIWARS